VLADSQKPKLVHASILLVVPRFRSKLGHRHSLDLDFFSPTEAAQPYAYIWSALASFHSTLADSSWGNLAYLVNGIRLGFYGFGNSWLE